MSRKTMSPVWACVAGLILGAAPAVFGDDFDPPPWDRNDPFATSAEWDFVTPPPDSDTDGFLGDEQWQPDGTEVPFNSGNSGHGTFITFGPDGIIAWDGEGSIVTEPSGEGGQITIDFDNIVDDEPFKILRIRITGSSSANDPIPSVEVTGADATDGSVTSEFLSSGFVQDSQTGDFSWGEDWQLEPNPDWEQIVLTIAPDTQIEQIVTDAISIPEPTSLALLSLSGLLLARRRSRC